VIGRPLRSGRRSPVEDLSCLASRV
jgi:hypothetical protein